MPFILAGSSLRVGLVAGDSILTTADSPAAVTFVIGGATIPGINKPGMDSRALYYGPLLSAAEVIIAAAVSTDYEVVRGLYSQVEPGTVVTLTATEIATPQPGILADTSATYKLNVAPFTRYRSDGTALVSLGSGGGGASLVVQEGDTTAVAAASTLDFAAADFDITETPANEANIAISSGISRTGHTHTASNISDFSEAVDDRVGALLVQGSNVTLTYNDAGNTLTIAAAVTGGSVVVQENDTTVEAAAATLDFLGADFDVTSSPAGEANIAISSAIARILSPVPLSVNTSLTAAAHGNRTLRVDTAGVVLTINNDATGGWVDADVLDIQAIGAGTFTLVQGTATLTTDSGASADSTTAVAKRVQAERTGASAWRTVSPVIVVGGASAGPVQINADTTLSRAAHGNRTIIVASGYRIFTLDTDAGAGWQDGDRVHIIAGGPFLGWGVVLAGGVTVNSNSAANNTLNIEGSAAREITLERISANAWQCVSSTNPITLRGTQAVNLNVNLILSHAGLAFTKTDTGSYTYTIPVAATVGFDAGTPMWFMNGGSAGTMTIVRAGALILWDNGVNTNVVLNPGQCAMIKKGILGEDVWFAFRG